VQDSFTPCHTERSGTRFETLTDVCTYGIDVPGVCLHSKPDLRDRIWLTNFECTITPDRPWDCLVPEAQAASNATAGYLLVVGRLIKATDWDGAPAALETWFAGDPTNPESGYFLCNGLKNDGWEPGPDAGAEAEAGLPEASPEGSTDQDGGDGGPDDGSLPESSVDAAPEVGPDAPAESGPEASAEAGPDAKSDAAPKPDAAAQPDAAAEAGEPVTTDGESESGCGCRAVGAGGHGGAWLAFSALGLFFAARRKRR